MFNESIYDQIDGISMGSPLAPALANLFMSHHEEKWLKSRTGKKVKFYKRYVDDIFCLMETEKMADDFLTYLNKQHKNLKFTIEKENNRILPFLDIKLEKGENGTKTSVYKKKTDTGLLTNFTSFVCYKYKTCLVKTLIDRIFKINNTWKGFHGDITKMEDILQKNNFPSKLITKNISQALNKKLEPKNDEKRNIEENIQYFKLPYIGSFSKTTEQKLKNIAEKYCKPGTLIKIAFTSQKISSYFSPKDKMLSDLVSHVVYKYSCSGCNSTYVGLTTCHLTKRIHEHFNTDPTSHIFQHLKKNKKCRSNLSAKSFEVLDKGTTEFQLRQKEAMWIKWLSPDINKQKKYKLNLSLLV